eukprot:s5667_g6.t1
MLRGTWEEKTLGPRHPQVSASTSILAAGLRDLGRANHFAKIPATVLEAVTSSSGVPTETALILSRRAVKMQRKVLGREHPATLDSMLLVAECLMDLSRCKEAAVVAQRALLLRLNVSGQRHPRTLAAAVIRAAVLRKQCRTGKARGLLSRTLRIQNEVFQGFPHPQLLSTASDYLELRCRGSRPAQVRRLRHLWQVQCQILGRRHPDVHCTAQRLACQRAKAEQYVCAPNFWGDLRGTLKAIEERRNERTSKSKAQQVLKQVARLEVKFWAKASVAMLKELDPESRIERIVDWLQTFGVEEDLVRWSAFFLTVPSELLASVAYQFQLEEDSSSGPAVLYQAACARLNDGS